MITKEELSQFTPKDDYLVQFILSSLARSDTELGKRYRNAIKFFNLNPKKERTKTQEELVKKYAIFFMDLKLSAYRTVRKLTNHEKADLLEYDNILDDFLKNFKVEESR
jgi:hypothetical protein